MKTLAEWCRERHAPKSTTRRVYDELFPSGPRAGLYRLVSPELSVALEKALRERGHLPEPVHA